MDVNTADIGNILIGGHGIICKVVENINIAKHFLSEIARYPQLRQLLQHVCSVNLTQDGHYLAFDEALEFLVKFIKQNMTQRIISKDNFKLHIKSIQSERAITDLLFSELGDEKANLPLNLVMKLLSGLPKKCLLHSLT
jgi:hypothetical protein